VSPMSEPTPPPITELLVRLGRGERSASDELLPLVYEELHGVAKRVFAPQAGAHTLQATALVHEAYLKLLGNDGERVWKDRRHFFAVAATAMRRILIDHARLRGALKRGDRANRVTLSENVQGDDISYDLLDLGAALDELGDSRERVARVVELRFFGGLTIDEVAEELGVTDRTVQLDWRAGRAWLRKRLGEESA